MPSSHDLIGGEVKNSYGDVELEDARVNSLRGEVEVTAPDGHDYSGERLEDGVFTIPVRADLDEGVIKTELFIANLAPCILRRGDDDVSRDDYMWAYEVVMKSLIEFKKELSDIGFDISDLEIEATT